MARRTEMRREGVVMSKQQRQRQRRMRVSRKMYHIMLHLLQESEQPTNSNQPYTIYTATKSIGMLGSLAIAVNSLAGPAILQLPATYQMAGLIPTTVCLILVGILSSFCSLHMANVVSKVPGNANFDKLVDFSEPFRIFWGRRAFLATQIMFFCCTVCMNVAAIVDTAQVVDTFLGHSPMGSYGLTPRGVTRWEHGPCTRKEVKLRQCDPFDRDGDYILSAGYVIAAAFFLPISLMDLKDNTAWQVFGFFVLLVTSMEFIVSFSLYGLVWNHVPVWGGQWDSMLGVILFNFSLVVAIPAWLSEKKASVSVPKGALFCFGCMVVYVVVWYGSTVDP